MGRNQARMWDQPLKQVMAVIVACSGGSSLPISLFLTPKADHFGLNCECGGSHCFPLGRLLSTLIHPAISAIPAGIFTYLFICLLSSPAFHPLPSLSVQAVGRAITSAIRNGRKGPSE